MATSTCQRCIVVANVLFLALIHPSVAYLTNNALRKCRFSFPVTSQVPRVQESPLLSAVSPSNSMITTLTMKQESFPDTIVNRRNFSKIEQEFNDMITIFSKFTEEDIQSIPNPRVRALYEGVAASAFEPAVYRSFEVLFEDFGPLRVAGRMIFGKLKKQMEDNIAQRQDEVSRLMLLTGLEEQELRASRMAFMSIAHEGRDGKSVVTRQQLVDTGIAASFVEMMNFTDQDDFFKQLGGKEWKFEAFMSALQVCTDKQSCLLEHCNPSTVFEEALIRIPAYDHDPVDPRTRKYMNQYDLMVNKFKEWEDFVPKGDGRKLDILRGCFVGARNEKVVNALKIVYVDYTALRMAGDLIFKLMTALVKGSTHKD